MRNIVKLKINPVRDYGNPEFGRSKSEFSDLPTPRDIRLKLDIPKEDVGFWYLDKRGYMCIQLRGIGFHQIEKLQSDREFLNGYLIHLFYRSKNKLGYSQHENGSSNVGYWVDTDFKNWKQLKSEMKISNKILDELDNESELMDFYVDYEPNIKPERKIHKQRVNSLSDYSNDDYKRKFIEIDDMREYVERNSKISQEIMDVKRKESFKFFVNLGYVKTPLTNSIKELIDFSQMSFSDNTPLYLQKVRG